MLFIPETRVGVPDPFLTSVRADDSLWVAAELFAPSLGEVAVLLVLAGLPKPVLLAGTPPTVTGAMA